MPSEMMLSLARLVRDFLYCLSGVITFYRNDDTTLEGSFDILILASAMVIFIRLGNFLLVQVLVPAIVQHEPDDQPLESGEQLTRDASPADGLDDN